MSQLLENVLGDPARLAALERRGLLDSPPDEALDRLTRLAAGLLRAPVALVSLVDDHRQFFKSAVGLPEPWASRRETPLSYSFCQHVVATAAPLRVEDAPRHPLGRDNRTVAELGVVAPRWNHAYYAGEADPQDVVAAWMADDSARAAILDPGLDAAGVGVHAIDGMTWWSIVFVGP